LVILTTLLVLLTPVAVSYARAVLRPGHSSLNLRSGLWLRDHGMSWAVDLAEWCWYTIRRGHALHGTRPRPLTLSSDELESDSRLAAPLPEPHALACSFEVCARGEGAWSASGARVSGAPAIYTTFFRPDAGHARVWTAAALIDPGRVRVHVVAGLREPRDFHGAWEGAIPEAKRARLLAAFNSGFRFADSAGGFYAEGRVGVPLREGAASLVVYRDGHLDIRAWAQDMRIRPKIQAVRQNLDLIVDEGRSVGGLDRNADGAWGRWNHGLYTWRSGLGIRPDGALVYVAGDGLTLSSLAAALVQTGAERGMQLDIHDMWITFALFAHGPSAGEVRSEKLLPDMAFDQNRYLLPDDKDFIALFAR
jgi:hypothetical protein